MRSEDAARPRMAARHKLWCAIALGAIISGTLGGVGVQSVRAQSACMYEITSIVEGPFCTPNFPGAITPTAMNDHGVVVGWYRACSLDPELPFMWSEEMGLVAIELPEGVTSAEPRDINNNGEIVGSLFRPGVGTRAFRYLDDVWTELEPTGGGSSSSASGVNDDGWVAGDRATSPDAEGQKAIRWRGNVVEELASSIRDEGAAAADINVHRDATGTFGGLIFGRAFLWQGDLVTIIPPVEGGTSSDGRAINDSLAVTGQSFLDVKSGSVPRRSWIFIDDELTNLGTLPKAGHRTIANDISNAGQIVGECVNENGSHRTPFVWQHGHMNDLQALLVLPPDDLFFGSAHAINESGQIALSDLSGHFVVILSPSNRPLGDANIDCVVDERDLIAVLDDWGPQGGKENHPTDMVTSATFQPPGDGNVDGADLAVVLGNWNASSSRSSPTRNK